MSYSQLYLKKGVQIPTILSLGVLALVLFFVSGLFLTTSFTSKATKQSIARLEVTNLSSSQAVIIWQSEQEEQGWIVYGENERKLDQIALDERDFKDVKTPRLHHYVIVKNLRENSPVFFKIATPKQLIGDTNGKSFQFTTLAKTTQVSNLKPAYGKIVQRNGSPLEDAVIILSVGSAYKLSTLSKSSGEWLIPLNYIIDKGTRQLKPVSGENAVKIEMIAEGEPKSTVTTTLSNLSPLPETVVIGQNYSFQGKENVLSSTSSTRNNIAPDITFPRERSIIAGKAPLIKGVGVVGSTVQVTLNGGRRSFSFETKVQKDGSWKISITDTLSPGAYSLSFLTKDQNGKDVSKARTFSIAKSGETVLGEATGSATPTATPTATLQATGSANLTSSPPVSGGGIFNLLFSGVVLVIVGTGLLLAF